MHAIRSTCLQANSTPGGNICSDFKKDNSSISNTTLMNTDISNTDRQTVAVPPIFYCNKHHVKTTNLTQFPQFSTKALGVIICQFGTINIQTITLTCATSAAYTSQCPTAPCNQLMAKRQLSWNPTALC